MTTAEVRPDEAGARGSSTSAQSRGYFGRPQCRSPSVVVAEEAEESDPALTTHPESGGCRFKRGGAVTPGLIFLVQAAVVVVVPAVLLRVSGLKGLVLRRRPDRGRHRSGAIVIWSNGSRNLPDVR